MALVPLATPEEQTKARANSKKPDVVERQRFPVRYHVEDHDTGTGHAAFWRLSPRS